MRGSVRLRSARRGAVHRGSARLGSARRGWARARLCAHPRGGGGGPRRGEVARGGGGGGARPLRAAAERGWTRLGTRAQTRLRLRVRWGRPGSAGTPPGIGPSLPGTLRQPFPRWRAPLPGPREQPLAGGPGERSPRSAGGHWLSPCGHWPSGSAPRDRGVAARSPGVPYSPSRPRGQQGSAGSVRALRAGRGVPRSSAAPNGEPRPAARWSGPGCLCSGLHQPAERASCSRSGHPAPEPTLGVFPSRSAQLARRYNAGPAGARIRHRRLGPPHHRIPFGWKCLSCSVLAQRQPSTKGSVRREALVILGGVSSEPDAFFLSFRGCCQ